MTDSKLNHKGRQMEMTLRTKASPEQVYEAWADPGKISQWFTDDARGEASVGETITWIFKSFGIEIPYEVVAADPGERFAVLYESPERSGLLEIQIRTEGGETVMRLINSGFQETEGWEEEYEGIRSGWAMAISLLKLYVEEYFAQPKETLLVVKDADYDWDRVNALFHEEAELGKWLTVSGGVGSPGETCRLELQDLGPLSGKVIADTGRETAVSWTERQAALEFKAFGGPWGKKVGVRVTLWSANKDDLPALQEAMDAAANRLAEAVTDKAGGS